MYGRASCNICATTVVPLTTQLLAPLCCRSALFVGVSETIPDSSVWSKRPGSGSCPISGRSGFHPPDFGCGQSMHCVYCVKVSLIGSRRTHFVIDAELITYKRILIGQSGSLSDYLVLSSILKRHQRPSEAQICRTGQNFHICITSCSTRGSNRNWRTFINQENIDNPENFENAHIPSFLLSSCES